MAAGLFLNRFCDYYSWCSVISSDGESRLMLFYEIEDFTKGILIETAHDQLR